MTLLDIRDELAATRNFAAAVYMACDARSMLGEQGAALCEVSNLVRERLEIIVVAFDRLLAQQSSSPQGEL